MVFGLLVGQLQDAGGGALRVGFVVGFLCDLAAVGLLARLLGVDICVFVPGLGRSGDDGVPDDSFRGR